VQLNDVENGEPCGVCTRRNQLMGILSERDANKILTEKDGQ